MMEAWTTILGALPVLLMAAAIALIPLFSDGPSQLPVRKKARLTTRATPP
jgi:hypothetical protein